MPISIDQNFSNMNAIPECLHGFMEKLRQCAKILKYEEWGYSRRKGDTQCYSINFDMGDVGLGFAPKMVWYIQHFTAKGEAFINCYNCIGSDSKNYSMQLATALNHAGIKCRVTTYKQSVGVAVDANFIYDLKG